jgi:hypothetical protein
MDRKEVYVVGAGFSAGLGYPLTSSLLIEVWDHLESNEREGLGKVIKFHHPQFDASKKTSFPNIEQLLTEFSVNEELFEASRPSGGNFTKSELYELREALLFTIAQWFHKLYQKAKTKSWLSDFRKRIDDEKAAIISFNWDLVLDHLLFSEPLTPESYGLAETLGNNPVLIKPHGSLNWFDSTQISKVKRNRRVEIFPNNNNGTGGVEAFLFPRSIRSKTGRRYTPLIVPPTYLKDFNRPIFRHIWNRSTELLSTAKNLYFLGYSLPAADLQAQFILRCGFHNQIEGRLKPGGGRYPPTGPVPIFIVNPDQGAARRIEAVAGPQLKCQWVYKKVEDWLADATKV